MNKRTLYIGILLSVAVIGYVLATLDWSKVASTLDNLNWCWLLVGFSIYLLNYFLRAVRFCQLLNLGGLPFRIVLGVTGLYGMYLYMMPAKFGEITFPILVKRRLQIDISTSTGGLIVARVFDFFTISLILPVVLFFYWDIIPVHFRMASMIFAGLVFLMFVFFLWLLRQPEIILPWLENKVERKDWIQLVKRFIAGVYRGSRQVEERGLFWQVLLLTIGIWICINANFYLITLALGYSFNFFQIVVVSIIMIPVTLFPIQGFANLGAHELGWVTAFRLFDFPYQEALNIAVSSHIVYVLFVLLLGGLGAGLLLIRSNEGFET